MSLYVNKQGFTLIEVLIASAISFFVAMAAFSIFNYSQTSYNVQEDIAAMQQDIRVAKRFIEREARMAGAGLATYPTVAGVDPTEDLVPFIIENNQGENGSDILTINYVIPTNDSCGEDGDTTDDIDSCSSLKDVTLNAEMPASSSIAKIKQDLSNSAYNDWKGECYCDGITYDNSNSKTAMPVIIQTPAGYTPAKSEVVYITSVNDTGSGTDDELQNHKYKDDNGVEHPNKIINLFPEGSIISFFSLKPIETFKFYIDDNNVLMREDLANDPGNPQPIAEHVEDLQFAFGVDENGDDIIDDDEWIDCSDASDMDGNDLLYSLKEDIRALRINVLGRTAKARKEIKAQKRPAIEDHAEAETADYFRRRLSQVEVKLRNVGIWDEI